MRLFLTIFCTLSFFISQAQEQSDQRISVSFNNDTLEEAILKIENQSSLKFYYLEDWFQDERVSGNYSNALLKDILTDIFKDTLLNFYILNGSDIILTKNNAIHDTIPEDDTINTIEPVEQTKPVFNEEVETQEETEEETPIRIGKEETTPVQTKYKISGVVKNIANGQPMPNVAVSVKGGTVGTSTDINGYYELLLPTGSYTLITNSLNAKDTQRKIVVYNDGEVNFNLEEKFETLDEVVIEADADKNVKEVIAGVTKIDVEGIKNIPLVLGERDILKVATTLPGITTTGEGSNGYNVRGGKTDQNLILLDNAAIYNPSHFFGIFSAINPFTTGDVNIYKGNIPAEYGGRLSSVFDISSKDATTEKFSGEASVGPVTSNLVLELPVVKDKAGILVGGRTTYSGWILRSLDEEELKNSEASFFDAIVKGCFTLVYFPNCIYQIATASIL